MRTPQKGLIFFLFASIIKTGGVSFDAKVRERPFASAGT